jgi:hypothetical protein
MSSGMVSLWMEQQMKQKELCNKIGMADRSFRRLSPAKRKQWQALAANGRTAAFYDVLAQLCFEVDAFNAADTPEWFWLRIDTCGVAITRFHMLISNTIMHLDCTNDDQLTNALHYVRSLNNQAK